MILNNASKSSSESIMNPLMIGPKRKFAWAMQHANHIEEIYNTWRKSMISNPPVNFPNNQSPGKLTFTIKSPAVDPLLALVVGDFVHNLRVSLDHLVGQLASLEGCDIKKHSTLAFPIYTNESDYKDNAIKKINKFIKDEAVLKEVEAVQPYHHTSPEGDPLWLLSELDNIDKHRLLLVVKSAVKKKGEPLLTKGPADNDKPPADMNRYTMGFQSEIQKNPVFTEKSASHHMTVWVDTTIILTDTRLACDGWPIQELIRILSGRVNEILNIFECRFFMNK
jgi:hypothetical protein